MGSDQGKRRSLNLFLFNYHTSSCIQALVHASLSIPGGSDFSQEDGLHQSRLGSQLASIVQSSRSRDHLTTSSVNRISVKNAIQNVNPDTSHVFFAKWRFLCRPLPSRLHRISQFVHVLNTRSLILQQVRSSIFWTERPDLQSILFIIFIFISQKLSPNFRVVFRGNCSLFDRILQLVHQGNGNRVDSVVLIWRFRHAGEA